jgi:hypothetical protein
MLNLIIQAKNRKFTILLEHSLQNAVNYFAEY